MVGTICCVPARFASGFRLGGCLSLRSQPRFERIFTHHGSLLKEKTESGISIRAIVAINREIQDRVYSPAKTVMDTRYIDDICGRLYLYDGKDILLAYHALSEDGYLGISPFSTYLCTTLTPLQGTLGEWRSGVREIRKSLLIFDRRDRSRAVSITVVSLSSESKKQLLMKSVTVSSALRPDLPPVNTLVASRRRSHHGRSNL